MKRSVILGLLQLALLGGMLARYLYQRATLPRVWALSTQYDPYLPIRGRYVRMSVHAAPRGFPTDKYYGEARLTVENGALTARPGRGVMIGFDTRFPSLATISEPVPFFIPEHAPDPSILKSGEELWVEVSVPGKGPPRPIRLGIKKNGELKPLVLQ